MTESGLILKDVGFSQQGKAILSGISLELGEKRIGIAGRNGSGKTTLLRVMAGLVAPSSGTVLLDGIDPWTDRKAALSRVGILFQNPDHQIIFPTVGEELAFGLRQMGQTDATAREAVARILANEGRAHWASAPVHTLSQGQRQYLCLLAVLAMGPGTILLDEPFAALDMPTQIRLSRRLETLEQRLIVVSHDPDVLAEMERVVWIEGGRVQSDGPAGPVLEEFAREMKRLGAVDADADLSG
ncbi:energy-coupling factor ABC transporter ATP-binding protein [Tabrizicola sp. J26]|uniref:energy-coupling factor ABC transporter ATP-binding protein n=1 Tax=Alitabrizicola rongguiensis TaxID=2909234 RepID=UPI001F3B29BB|nr:ABC transporter ATP-binding protein [Tabrizicola rongguiensis]MCF1707271.1 energy-coupling factor ABC transporter ATP-binding protein [Tabrizicola rongguiensis]